MDHIIAVDSAGNSETITMTDAQFLNILQSKLEQRNDTSEIKTSDLVYELIDRLYKELENATHASPSTFVLTDPDSYHWDRTLLLGALRMYASNVL